MVVEKGIEVEFLRLIPIWLFPEKEIRKISHRVESILIPEMNLGGQVSNLIKQTIEGEVEVVHFNKVSSQPITV